MTPHRNFSDRIKLCLTYSYTHVIAFAKAVSEVSTCIGQKKGRCHVKITHSWYGYDGIGMVHQFTKW
jgi:hypothetical protein